MALTPNRVRTTVHTNHFEVIRLPSKPFYQYDGIEPEIPAMLSRRSREVVAQLQTEHPNYFTPRAVYDGKSILYSVRDNIPPQQFVVSLNPRLTYNVRFTSTKRIDPNTLRNAVGREGQINQAVITLFQLIVRQAPSMRHIDAVRTRSFYHSKGEKDLGGGLVAWHGFFQSIRPTLGKILINIDTTTAVMYKGGHLLDVAITFLKSCGVTIRGPHDLVHLHSRNNSGTLIQESNEWKKLQQFLRGVRISTELPSGHSWRSKGRPIKRLVTEAGHYTFVKDDKPTTVQEHISEAHGKQTQFPLIFGVMLNKGDIYPAEFCKVLPGQFYNKMLGDEQRSLLVKHSTKNPVQRLGAIQNAVSGRDQVFDYANSDFLQAVGMQVSTTPITVNAQVINAPSINYQTPLQIENGQWNVRNNVKFAAPATVYSWGVIVFDAQAKQDTVRDFVTRLHGNLTQRGISINPHYKPGPQFPLAMGNSNDVPASLYHVAKQASYMDPNSGKMTKPTVIVVILPSFAAQIRKQVKYWSTVQARIPTQCVRAGKYESLKDQYLNNVALKINAKIGGVNSYVHLTESILNRTMVIGCDISHPAPKVENRPSIASLVASVDSRACFYSAKIQVQEPRVEIIQNVGDMVWSILNDYHSFHTKQHAKAVVLDHVIVFRDGVSEGEYEHVSQYEIRQIDEQLEKLHVTAKIPKPKLTFIIVTKRHHVRFFPPAGGRTDRSGNCVPGLVIDNELNTGNDFYLQSHSGIQGTSRPSHYIILRNDMNWSVAQVQELCYYLCHVYASATRSVSIPAPVYYADLACAKIEYLINPERFEALDNESVASGGELPLKQWQEAVEDGGSLMQKLYFL